MSGSELTAVTTEAKETSVEAGISKRRPKFVGPADAKLRKVRRWKDRSRRELHWLSENGRLALKKHSFAELPSSETRSRGCIAKFHPKENNVRHTRKTLKIIHPSLRKREQNPKVA